MKSLIHALMNLINHHHAGKLMVSNGQRLPQLPVRLQLNQIQNQLHQVQLHQLQVAQEDLLLHALVSAQALHPLLSRLVLVSALPDAHRLKKKLSNEK